MGTKIYNDYPPIRSRHPTIRLLIRSHKCIGWPNLGCHGPFDQPTALNPLSSCVRWLAYPNCYGPFDQSTTSRSLFPLIDLVQLLWYVRPTSHLMTINRLSPVVMVCPINHGPIYLYHFINYTPPTSIYTPSSQYQPLVFLCGGTNDDVDNVILTSISNKSSKKTQSFLMG